MLCPHLQLPCERLSGAQDYYRSPSGAIYFAGARSLQYDDDYFLEEYRLQYGRTYTQDEQNLRRLARRRIEQLLLPRRKQGELLEIGCATGFFLKEAQSAGFSVRGLEVSDFAAREARSRDLPVTAGSFLDFTETTVFDVVAAFYVLEHFSDQRAAFEQISRLIKPGGLFLFALPSTHGPLFTCNQKGWVESHPLDHFADYSPASLRQILPAYGLKLLETQPASYHPERSCGFWQILSGVHPGLYRLLARRLTYGDTMEGIARKV
ncbi:MAG: class I SAM-dependent methyltransferase [Spirochaetales bacterium]|nr:class I SAM-dependent methyltransferase [Spirochaetales bacterium]